MLRDRASEKHIVIRDEEKVQEKKVDNLSVEDALRLLAKHD